MPVKFVSLESSEPEPAGHHGFKDVALTSPAGCGTGEEIMTFIDADKMFIETLGDIPWTFSGASKELYEVPNGGGILKRLMAAVKSTGQRGIIDGEWSFTPVGVRWSSPNGAVTETVQTGVFKFSSDGGQWSSRSWSFEAHIDVCLDEHGNESFAVSSDNYVGTATVTSKDGSDPTEFRGLCVARFIAGMVQRCAAHGWVSSVVYPEQVSPEWHSRAVQGMAQIAACAAVNGDDSGTTGLIEYLSGQWCDVDETSHVLMLDKVVSAIGTVEQVLAIHRAYSTWKGHKLSNLGDEIEMVVGTGIVNFPGFTDFEEVFREAANSVAATQQD